MPLMLSRLAHNRALRWGGALLLIVAAMFWFSGREATLQRLLQTVADASGGSLAVSGVSGSLHGAMHVQRLSYRHPQRRIVAENVDLEWAPWQLLSGDIAILRLRAQALTIENLPAPPEPPQLPQTLALPVALDIGAADIQQITIVSPDSRIQLQQLHFALAADRRQWRLRDASVGTPWGRLATGLTLAANRPFALAGDLGLTPAAPVGGQVQARLSGTLADLLVAATGSSHGATAEAALSLTPFAPQAWRALSLNARGIDPARWRTGLPLAELQLELALRADTSQALAGQLALNNRAAPGSLDQQRLPLQRLSAELAGTLSALRFGNVLLDLGAAGRFAGSGSVQDPKTGNAEFTLHTDRIDLKEVHGRLHSTKIAGDIVLGNRGATQTLQAALVQGDLRLNAQATLADGVLRLQQARLLASGSSVQLAGSARINGEQAFAASGSVQRFNPARFGTYPAADLNAAFQLDGHLLPAWQVKADVSIKPSRLFNQPLSGHAKLGADPAHLRAVDARLALGSNLISAQGDFGKAGDRLQWQVDGRQLDALRANLSGALQANGTLSGTFAAPVTSFDAQARGLQLVAKERQPGRPAVRAGNDSLLQARGELALRGAGAFQLNGDAQRVNPAAFGAYPQASLNGSFDASGRIGSDWRVALDLQLKPSTLLNAPLAGHAKLSADPAHVSNADVDLRLAENSLSLKGNFGAPPDQLDWRLAAPRLAALGPEFGGAASGSGTLGGTLQLPVLAFALDGRELQWLGDYRIKLLRANGRLEAGDNSPLQAQVELAGLQSPALALQALQLHGSGTRNAHTLTLAARNDSLDAQLELAGGWSAQRGWDGMLRTLQNRGRFPLALQGPAPLRWHDQQLALSNAQFRLERGSIAVQTLERNGAAWRSRGQAQGVPLAFLAQFSKTLRDNLETNLTLGADWSLDAGDSVNGALRIFRERGDATLHADVPLVLGLSAFELRTEIANNALHTEFELAGARVGRVHFAGSTQLARRDGQWGIAGDSPLALNGGASMASVAWLAPLSGQPGLELDGSLSLALAAGGTLAAPQLRGELAGDRLQVRWADEGLKLRNGRLRAQLNGDQLLLQQLRFDGEEGVAHAEGSARYADNLLTMQVQLVAERLLAISRPDRLLVVSGQSSLTLGQKRLQLTGKFKAERATVELPSYAGPTLSNDVVVLGARGKQGKQAKKAATVPFGLDLEADLGDEFYLRGKGLDAQLAGSVRIRTLDNQRLPRANGTIRVVKGSYAAYGQRLEIERGLLSFNGPLDNPAVSILAVRKLVDPDSGVEAGVEVRGSALAPSARLVSTPSVPDSEKLSWLVLGHGTESAGNKEFDALATAANALLGASQAASLQARLAQAFGLDQLGLGRVRGTDSKGQGLESTVLTLGKRLSSRAYLTYEQGASSASSLVKLRYALNPRLSLQAQTGTNNALDLFYSWSFD
jgi:translocation and assembly module TamB